MSKRIGIGPIQIRVNTAGNLPDAGIPDHAMRNCSVESRRNVFGAFTLITVDARDLVERRRPGPAVRIRSVAISAWVGGAMQLIIVRRRRPDALMKGLAISWPLGINVQCVCRESCLTDINGRYCSGPALARSSMKRIPLGGVGEPEDVAELVMPCFLRESVPRISTVPKCDRWGNVRQLSSRAIIVFRWGLHDKTSGRCFRGLRGNRRENQIRNVPADAEPMAFARNLRKSESSGSMLATQ